ncbi:GNAT family N-acetyltransferase [Aquimarina rhabdastrellae]
MNVTSLITQVSKTSYEFSSTFPDFGAIHFRLFDLEQDIPLLHQWVNLDYAEFWGLQQTSLNEVKEEYTRLSQQEGYEIYIGLYNDHPIFLLERYVPQKDLIGNYYPAKKMDYGVHILVAPPPSTPIPNFTWYIFKAIMQFTFKAKNATRILVEPDIRNKKMFAICERIGFTLDKIVTLPHKTAQLAFLTKERFEQIHNTHKIIKRSAMNTINNTVSPQQAIAHIQPEVWKKANRLLIKKSICEFSHELLITPEIISSNGVWNSYILHTETADIHYTFEAKLLALNHLYIKTDTITKFASDKEIELDAILFIKEFRNALGIEDATMPTYLEEIISTLYGSAYKLLKGNPVAKDLAIADFQTIEQSMMEGHPGFVANNGRVGFDSSDYRSYAPESGNTFSLLWLAGHKEHTVYAAIEDLPYQKLITQELGEEVVTAFNTQISDLGFSPEDYFFIPMHPWQWFNKLANIYAPQIATGKLICLGYSPDQYNAQQSIRTLFNVSNPHKLYTKTALSILNMGFMRGLPLYYLGTAPKMAKWLEHLLYTDTYIQETGFKMLGEIASVSFVNTYYEEFGTHNDYNKMLASLWRESPFNAIQANQRLMTMAAFLHVDQHGDALLPELIKASGVTIDTWLQHYFKAYLSPLLHCFYQYDLVFMPHGENLIMVIEDHLPVSVFLKDITEEAVILNPEVALPEPLKRMYAPVPEDVKLLSIFTDIFDGFFRFMAHILEEHAQYAEKDFWKQVAQCILDYQAAFPQLQEKFEQYDLFATDFHLSCLNRLQLNNNKQMIDLDDPVALLQFAGKLDNPIATYKPVSSAV